MQLFPSCLPDYPCSKDPGLELQQEKDYDLDKLADRFRTNLPLLNAEQKNVYDSLMKVVDDGIGMLLAEQEKRL